MKPFVNKKTTKNLIIILVVTTILTGLLPNFVQAKTDTGNGGGLLEPIEKFVVYLCDNVMQWLQDTFTSTEKIKQDDGSYKFQYSPAIIFSGKVPALDINFITSDVKESTIVAKYDSYVENVLANNLENAVSTDSTSYLNAQQHSNAQYIDQVGTYGRDYACYWVDEESGKIYIECCYAYPTGSAGYLGANIGKRYYSSFAFTDDDEVRAAYQEVTVEAKYQSTAAILKSTIATWYNALRRIALVGLLSVLVYVGIRIVLTSSSGDKAKYKGMLKDWLVALCLLFTLHYIMNVTLTVTNEISDIFATGETDILLNDLRDGIHSGDSWGQVLAQVIMYVVLVIHTVTFTIQYLKRVIYMAFYTLIAPLITLTYPLDKIKDGQAQAFNMWIREYIFTALTQVIHLVIYFVLVSSAMSLVRDYPLYAIIVLTFMKKAEDIIKKMFGFDKSETVGTLGKAAAGGMIMNAINKMKGPAKQQKGGKEGGSGSSSNSVRTASGDPLSALKGKGEEPTPGGVPGSNNNYQQGNSGAGGVGESQQNSTKPKKSIKGVLKTGAKGAGALIKRYHRQVLGGAAGVFLGGTGAMIGLAAGISQGDLGAAAAGAIAGGKGGYGLGGRVYNGVFNTPGNIGNALNNLGDTWNEGAYGEEYASNVKFDREFRRSSAYKALRQKYGDDFSDKSVQAMLEAGITEQGAMDKILKNVTDGNRYNIKDAIGYYTLAKKCPDSLYYDDSKFTKWLQDQQGLSQQDAEDLRNNMKNFR